MKLRQIIAEEVARHLKEVGPSSAVISGVNAEAKKRGLKSIGGGRYVDPAKPGVVVARAQNEKLVLTKQGQEDDKKVFGGDAEVGGDGPAQPTSGADGLNGAPPERALPQNQEPTQAGSDIPLPAQRGRGKPSSLYKVVSQIVDPEKVKRAIMTGDGALLAQVVRRLDGLKKKMVQAGASGKQIRQITEFQKELSRKVDDAKDVEQYGGSSQISPLGTS